MKKYVSILLISILAVLQLSAKRDKVPSPAITSKMERAAEKYIKMVLKEFPEKAEGLSSTKARKKMYEEMAKSKILTLDGATQVKLKDRDEVVTDPQMQTMIKNLEGDDSKETKFLLTLAANERIKGEAKLLIFRLMGQIDVARKKQAKEDLKQAEEDKKKAMADIFEHYQTRVKELGRMPADAEELALPESLAKIDGKDWIYFGTRLKLGVGKARVLLFDPNASPAGGTVALTDKGSIVNLKHEEMMAHWNKVKDKPAPKPNVAPKPTPENQPAPVVDAEYDKKVKEQFTAVFKKVVDKRNVTQIWPVSLEEAGVEEKSLTQDSPDGTEKKPWIYVASKAKLAVSKTQFIILAAPYPSGGNQHYVALSDGKVVTMSGAEFKKVEAALKGK